MNRVVMIWLDGFSASYLDHEKMPYLYELAQVGFSTTLEPLFAFAGIGISTFTGTTVNNHKFWTDYIHDKHTRYPTLLKGLFRLCDLLPSDILDSYARYVICRIMGINPGTPNLIPISLVDYFRTKEQKRITDPNPIEGTTTLFDQLRRYDVPFLNIAFYESILEKRIISRVLKALNEDYSLILFRLGSLDKLGHRYGPESEQMIRKLREIDATIKEIVESGERADANPHFIIYTDHGMSPVREYFDVNNVLKALPLKMPDDYIMFLNSTVANFWFKNNRARETIAGVLATSQAGIVLNEVQKKALEIEEIGMEYGELLFAINEGNVFFPDFYRRRLPPKGMHGYAFPAQDRPSFIVYSLGHSYEYDQDINARFIDVMPTILRLLDLPVPESCDGRSLLEG